jgi:hypothetical protein
LSGLTAFQVPGLYQFGNSGVDILNGPGTKQRDCSMFKSFYFDRDRHRSFQVRAELFNLLNAPQFNNPPPRSALRVWARSHRPAPSRPSSVLPARCSSR